MAIVDRDGLIGRINRAATSGVINQADQDRFLARVRDARRGSHLQGIARELDQIETGAVERGMPVNPEELTHPIGATQPVEPGLIKLLWITVGVMVLIAILGLLVVMSTTGPGAG